MATSTGLSQIGNALAQGAGDYANIQLRRQAEERQRAQQLADLQDQRAYNEGQQGAAVGRQKELALWQARQQRIQELISKGFLAQADAADDAKIAAADLAEQTRSGNERTRADTGLTNMQASANALGEQVNQLYDASAQVQARLASIPTSPRRPDPRQVEAMAIQMATEAGENPQSDAVRAKYLPAAQKALEGAAMQEFFIAQEAADALKVSLQGYNSQISAITSRLGQYERSGIVPTVSAPPPSAAFQQDFGAPSQPRRATPEEQAAAAGLAPAPAPASSPASLQSQEYGGIRGMLPSTGTVQAALSNPVGAAEIALRSGVLEPIGRNFDVFIGGDRQAAEGDAARAAAMAGAVQRFNTPSASLPPNPFFTGRITPPGSLSRLPALPPMRKPPSQSPAFQFSNTFAPGN
jgi:hypothetical protein